MTQFFMCLALLGLFLAGCNEEQQRVPYIPPTLANWPQPYRGVTGLKVHIFVTGELRAPEALVLRGGNLSARKLLVPVVLVEHPKQGLVLFNTGLDPKRTEGTLPGTLLSLIGPTVIRNEGITTSLRQAGFKPEGVRWVVLSSMRADHTGGLRDFPQARVVVTKAEHEYALDAPTGYIPADVASVANWKFIDFEPPTPLATFAAAVDLFDDGSCMLLDARGTTPGNMAMLVRLPQRPLLLAADLAPVEESVRYAAKPATAADMDAWWEHIWRLKRFKDLVPELIVIPGHDVNAAQAASSKDIVVHPLAPVTPTEATPTASALRRLLPG